MRSVTVREEVNDRLEARRAEAAEQEIKAAEAGRLADEVQALREERAPLERRNDALAKIGSGHIDHTVTAHIVGVGNVSFGPLKSPKTGDELAEHLAPRIAQITEQIPSRELTIKELLS